MKTFEVETADLPHSHRLRCVILAARGFKTTDALTWLSREHVAVFIVWEGEFLAVADAMAGRLSRQESAVRRRQMECVLDPNRRLVAARELVGAKIETLKFSPAAKQVFTRKLAKARSIEDAMVIEAEAGAAYWRGWKGQEIEFKDGSRTRFDARRAGVKTRSAEGSEWSVFTARSRSWRTGRLGETGTQFSNRFALHPINAMLNYAGAIVVAQCARALAGLGCDGAFGVLHSARPGMAALAWDVFELLRARTETAVFGFVGSRKFEAGEFKIVREPKPHVRFGAVVGRGLAMHVMRAVPFRVVVKTCKEVMELF